MSKLKLVIADDQENWRRTLVRSLNSEFSVLDAVGDGMELLGSAILLRPDVIVSDINMPLLTGPQAMRELSMRGVHIPFVFISADEGVMEPHAVFVPKEEILNDLIPTIYRVALGRARGICLDGPHDKSCAQALPAPR